MIGNVFEWVEDWYTPDSYTTAAAADPAGSVGSSYKVYRGCGWFSEYNKCRASYRGFDLPSNAHHGVGFRVVRTPR
jgi:formylglycine-generating enzyme required for sulfatase activity